MMTLTADYDHGPCSPMMTTDIERRVQVLFAPAAMAGWTRCMLFAMNAHCIDQLMTMYLEVYDNHVHVLYATMTESCTYDDGWM